MQTSDNSEHYAELSHQHGYVTAIMIRDVEASARAVWAMLSDESERIKWLAPGTIELIKGGHASLDFKDSYVLVESEVTQCQEPCLLEFSWSSGTDPERPIRFEITESTANNSTITLTVSIPDSEVVARSCAGWEAHLTMLQAALMGVPVKFPLERFKACREFLDNELAQLMMSEVPVLRL